MTRPCAVPSMSPSTCVIGTCVGGVICEPSLTVSCPNGLLCVNDACVADDGGRPDAGVDAGAPDAGEREDAGEKADAGASTTRDGGGGEKDAGAPGPGEFVAVGCEGCTSVGGLDALALLGAWLLGRRRRG